MRETRGFTLIELMVVISIVGFLSSVVIASLNSVRKKGRDAVRQRDMRQMQVALDLYADEHNGNYPRTNSWACADCSGTYGSTGGSYVNSSGATVTIADGAGAAQTLLNAALVSQGYIGVWPNDPKPVALRGPSPTNYGYLYSSNGTGYVMLVYNTVEVACKPKSLLRSNQPTSYAVCSSTSYSAECNGNPSYVVPTSCP